MSKLLGKRALVTAGAQGIGLAISRALLAAGCEVFVHYHRSTTAAGNLASEAARLGRRCGIASADLTEVDACRELVTAALLFLGGLDILINNAGSLVARRTLDETDAAFWDEVMALNLGSACQVTRAAAPHLIAAAKIGGGASIINLSSLAGRRGGSPGSLAYSTSKGAILTFTRMLANELGPQGVRVNAIAPGLILGSSFHSVHTKPEAVTAAVAAIPLRRAGTTDEVARAAIFLASEFDGFINGATIDINGGILGY